MKLLLALAALLLVAFVVSERERESKWLLSVVNDVRRNHAKKNNIANMHELEFDISMYALSTAIGEHCRPLSVLNDDWISYNQYEIIPVLTDFRASREEASVRALASNHFLNPAQTKFGVSDHASKCGDYGYTQIFALGPEHEPIVKYGTPGSQCKEGRVNKNGLCGRK